MRSSLLIFTAVILLVLFSCTTNNKNQRVVVSNSTEAKTTFTHPEGLTGNNLAWQPSDSFIYNQQSYVRFISVDQEIKVGQQELSLNQPKYQQLASTDQYLYLNGFDIKPAYAVYRVGPFNSDAQPSKLEINFNGNSELPASQWKLNYAFYNPLKSSWQWFTTNTSFTHNLYYGYEWLYNYQGKKYLYIAFAVDKNSINSVFIKKLVLTAITYIPPKKAFWNVLLYFAGDNNLAEFAVKNLNQAEQVGSTDYVNIIAQYDINYPVVSNTDKVWRVKLVKDLNEKAIRIDGDPNNTSFKRDGFDSSSPQNLYDFLVWVKNKFPAERNCLVLWNHGSGWLPGHTQNRVTSSILGDDKDGPAGGMLADNTTISEAITKSGLPIDVLYFDACNMGQLEALYDFRSNARYIVASQLLVPGPGGQYYKWLMPLILNPNLTSLDLAQKAVDAYNYQYSYNYIIPCTLSVYDTAYLDSLTQTIYNLGLLLKAYKDTEKSRMGNAIINSYTDDAELSNGSKDLLEFVTYMKTTDNDVIKKILEDIEKTHKSVVVYHKRPNLNRTNGLAMFLPDQFDLSINGEKYKKIAFNQTTGWLDALITVGVPVPNNSYESTHKIYDNWKVRIYWDANVDLDLWCYEPSLIWNSPATTQESEYCIYSADANGNPGKEEWVIFKPNPNKDKYYIVVDYFADQPATGQAQFWAQIIDDNNLVLQTIGPRTINKGEKYNLFELLKQ